MSNMKWERRWSLFLKLLLPFILIVLLWVLVGLGLMIWSAGRRYDEMMDREHRRVIDNEKE